MTTNQTPDSTSGQAATARRMIGGVYGHRRWHEERGTCEQKGCTAMTTNQTPEQAAINAYGNAVLRYGDLAEAEEQEAALEKAITAYGEARYAAGRRDALEAVNDLWNSRPDLDSTNGFVSKFNALLYAARHALATPTETKPTEERW